jgi:hypothetical protein
VFGIQPTEVSFAVPDRGFNPVRCALPAQAGFAIPGWGFNSTLVLRRPIVAPCPFADLILHGLNPHRVKVTGAKSITVVHYSHARHITGIRLQDCEAFWRLFPEDAFVSCRLRPQTEYVVVQIQVKPDCPVKGSVESIYYAGCATNICRSHA